MSPRVSGRDAAPQPAGGSWVLTASRAAFALVVLLFAAAAADPFDAKLDLYRKAAEYQARLERNPADADTLRNLALVYGRLGLFDKARSLCVELVRLEPANARHHYDLGWTWHKQGSLEAACAHYRDALALDPALESALYNLSVALCGRSDFAGAYEVALGGLARHPESPKLHLAAADALHRKGDHGAARAFAERAAALHPGYFEAHYLRTAIALAEGRTGEARLAFAECRRLSSRALADALADPELAAFAREEGEKPQ